MTLRVLVDENTSPRIATRLQDAGHDAVHVLDALGEGTEDADILSYAAKRDYAVLTHDDDFLVVEEPDVPILYYPNSTIATADLAQQVLRVSSVVRSNSDLAPVTYLGKW